MSGQPVPFPATAKVIRITVLPGAATAAVQLPAASNQVRIVNHGADVYLAFSDTQAGAVATAPTPTASATSCPSLGGSDIVMSIAGSTAQWVSAILDSGVSSTTNIDVAIGEGI